MEGKVTTMMYVRIKSYDESGAFTGCEHLYSNCSTLNDGIQRFRDEYPEHEQCLIIAEYYDATEECNKEHFEICKACGCVH